MNRSHTFGRATQGITIPRFGAALGLALAITAGLLLTEVLISPPPRDMRSLAAYLSLSGIATMGAGWVALQAADRAMRLSIQSKAFLSAMTGSAVALLNVVIVAQLMFISTSHDLRLLISLIVFSAIVTGFFSLWVARAAASRLALISDALRTLAGGDLKTRVIVTGQDEVADLAADVNVLAERIEAAEEQRDSVDRERRELTSAISHDLRTPLASLRAMVEALDDRVVSSPADVTRYYSTMRKEIERLGRMVDDLFILAQIDAGALRLDKTMVNINELVADVVDAMHALARSRDVAIEVLNDRVPCSALLDERRIERAITNLLRNAIEHTPGGGRVRVAVSARNGVVECTVDDSGEGIDPKDLPHIWSRFYRAEKSRSRGRDSDGAGLGLAIVRGIVEAHDGSVSAGPVSGGGARFRIALPA